ncbi:MAG: phosphatase PAP2 family protein [Verrucomicrobia bacterium]|nr:phosphatase PAP2 family protein [Verrucomicrobiota bacterium]
MLRTAQRLLVLAGRIARERWGTLSLLFVVMAVGCALILPHDRTWSGLVSGCDEPWHKIATLFSRWGDYWTGTLIITGVLWLAGKALRRPFLRVAALACLLGASVAGLEVDIVRFATGRPRPGVGLPDGLYGPHFHRDFLSFPSAHTTTAFGTAGVLAVALPPVGVPLLAGAAGVGWSRICQKSHFPSDVWVGAWVGSLNGVVLGFAARRYRREEEAKTDNTPAAKPNSRELS